VNVGGIKVGAQVLELDVGGRARLLRLVLRLQLLLWPRRRTHVVEPVKVRLDELDRDVGIQVIGRDDVEHRQAGHLVGMIESHPVGDPSAAIVPDHGELVEAEALHDLDLVERHRPLRVVGVVLAVWRLAAVAVAAQVGHDHRIVLGELGRDQPHRDVRLRRAVHQQQRRPRAGVHQVDLGARRLHAGGLEARKEAQCVAGIGLLCRCHLRQTRHTGGGQGRGHLQ